MQTLKIMIDLAETAQDGTTWTRWAEQFRTWDGSRDYSQSDAEQAVGKLGMGYPGIYRVCVFALGKTEALDSALFVSEPINVQQTPPARKLMMSVSANCTATLYRQILADLQMDAIVSETFATVASERAYPQAVVSLVGARRLLNAFDALGIMWAREIVPSAPATV